MKYLFLILISVFTSLNISAQKEYQFIVEDLLESKSYEGNFEHITDESFVYHLVRFNNGPFKKKDFKRFETLNNEYLNSVSPLIMKSHLNDEISINGKVFQKIEDDKNVFTYQYRNHKNVYIDLLKFHYYNGLLEKVEIRKYNPKTNKFYNLYAIQFFNYSKGYHLKFAQQ